MLQTKQKYTEQQLATQSSYSVQQIWHKEPTREGLIRARDAIVPCTMCTSNHERQTWRVNCHKHQISSGAVYLVTNMRQNTKIHLNFHNERCRDRDVDTDAQVQTSLPKIQRWPKKRGHRLMTIILSNLNRLKSSLEDSWVNLQLNGYLKSHRTLHMLLHYLVKHYCQQNKLLTTNYKVV